MKKILKNGFVLITVLFLSSFDSSTFSKKESNNSPQISEIYISGKVSNCFNSLPLAGVLVQVVGTGISATTNSLGNYSIAVPVGANTLIYSAPGFGSEAVSFQTSVDNINKNVCLVPELE